MGRGRAKAAAVVLCGALALVASGCGAQSHTNDPRPQVALQASVTINSGEVLVQPRAIATGPARTQQIPQNQNHPQPPIHTKAPATVRIVVTNQTGEEARLQLSGPSSATSGPIPGHSPGTLQADLETGTYTIAAQGVPGARPGKLVVGPYRASSENDVLLP
jgi:FtsP/CotA-like multicopper oxidase with cupredoxin domain